VARVFVVTGLIRAMLGWMRLPAVRGMETMRLVPLRRSHGQAFGMAANLVIRIMALLSWIKTIKLMSNGKPLKFPRGRLLVDVHIPDKSIHLFMDRLHDLIHLDIRAFHHDLHAAIR